MGKIADALANFGTVLLAVSAVVLTGLHVKSTYFGQGNQRFQTVDDWEKYATVGLRVGPERERPDVIVFSDYQCPACKVLSDNLAVLRQSGSDLTAIYRHFPLPGHEHARAAAAAVECASQEDAGPALHELLFKEQDQLGSLSWGEMGRRAGVQDTVQLRRCMSHESTEQRVSEDVQAGATLGVAGTPTLIIDGMLVRGSPPFDELQDLLNR